jgi:L-aspartate oxidase
VVFSHRAAVAVVERLARRDAPEAASGASTAHTHTAPSGLAAPEGETAAARVDDLRRQLRSLMWEQVGIVRSDDLLETAEHAVTALKSEWDGLRESLAPTPEGLELRNLLDTASLVVRCARLRLESRGLHYNVDHPWRNSEVYLRDTTLTP